ncbi:MAG TPA: hypothetical protein VIY27_12540, partial [Myxococcota bacterium]
MAEVTDYEIAVRDVLRALGDICDADSVFYVVQRLIEAARRCCDNEQEFETALSHAREYIFLPLGDGAERIAVLWYGASGEVALDVGTDGVWRVFNSRPGKMTTAEFPGSPTKAAASFAAAIGDALAPVARAHE